MSNRVFSRRRRRRGFTLMEILLVLVILVILGGMVGVFISKARTKAFGQLALGQLQTFKSQLGMYYLDVGSYPTSQQGLMALRQPPGDLRNPNKWGGPYADADIPLDPWQNAYEYVGDGASCRIWSCGPNGQSEQGGGDDIVITVE